MKFTKGGYQYGEEPVVPPPSTFTVDHETKPVLYLPDGRVLVRRPAGFVTSGDAGRTRSTLIEGRPSGAKG
jgi:hypothetical protein